MPTPSTSRRWLERQFGDFRVVQLAPRTVRIAPGVATQLLSVNPGRFKFVISLSGFGDIECGQGNVATSTSRVYLDGLGGTLEVSLAEDADAATQEWTAFPLDEAVSVTVYEWDFISGPEK